MQNLQRTQGQTLANAASTATVTGNDMANQNYQSSLAGYNAGNDAQNQVYSQGSNTYQNALAGYDAKNAAQNQAYTQGSNTYQNDLAGYQAGNAAQNQAYTQGADSYALNYNAALKNYMQPLDSMNAVLNGQQVVNPTFNTPNSTAGQAQGANILGAVQNQGQYNSAMYAAQQQGLSGLMGLGGTLGAAAIMASDKRLKKNIVKFGKTRDGHNAYVWDWKDGSGHAYGVIAQEIAKTVPHAVIQGNDGFLRVNYAAIR
jgi:hypothetical protein